MWTLSLFAQKKMFANWAMLSFCSNGFGAQVHLPSTIAQSRTFDESGQSL